MIMELERKQVFRKEFKSDGDAGSNSVRDRFKMFWINYKKVQYIYTYFANLTKYNFFIN